MWTSIFYNERALTGPFDGAPPDLVGIWLRQVVLEPALQTIHISLEWREMPANCPLRWRAQNYDRLQLRFSLFDVSDVLLSGVPADPSLPVSVDLRRHSVAISGGSLNLAATFQEARGVFHPYNGLEALDSQSWGWFRMS